MSVLLSFESRRSLFQKRARTFAHIVGGKQTRKKFCFQRQSFRERQLSPPRNGYEASANRKWRELGDLVRQGFCLPK